MKYLSVYEDQELPPTALIPEASRYFGLHKPGP